LNIRQRIFNILWIKTIQFWPHGHYFTNYLPIFTKQYI
jgi:hypothetical protein